MECIFCKILKGDIKTELIYEDPWVAAFNDIKPQAPIHIIIIPREHIEKIQDIKDSHIDLVGRLFRAAVKIADMKKIVKNGYRLVINCNKDAGQEVFHIHLHLMGGRKFGWPPG